MFNHLLIQKLFIIVKSEREEHRKLIVKQYTKDEVKTNQFILLYSLSIYSNTVLSTSFSQTFDVSPNLKTTGPILKAEKNHSCDIKSYYSSIIIKTINKLI